MPDFDPTEGMDEEVLRALLAKARRFWIAEDLILESRSSRGDVWVVRCPTSVVSADLTRMLEPHPSNQTDDFKRRAHFSLQEAFSIAQQYLAKKKAEQESPS